jgi:CheY-like chemotaxis protein
VAAPVTSGPASPDGVKLLIVDDEPRNLDALEAMLGGCGYTFIRASSPDEALLAMLQHDFAAMILDIRMPGMSGLELAQLIKQRKRTRDVPILFLTAHMMDEQRSTKPCNPRLASGRGPRRRSNGSTPNSSCASASAPRP